MIYKGNINSFSQWLELKEKGYTEVSGDFHCERALRRKLEALFTVHLTSLNLLKAVQRKLVVIFTAPITS